jgi:hypothetical protein
MFVTMVHSTPLHYMHSSTIRLENLLESAHVYPDSVQLAELHGSITQGPPLLSQHQKGKTTEPP